MSTPGPPCRPDSFQWTVRDRGGTGPRHLYDKTRSYGSAVMYDDGKILYAGAG